MSSLIPTFQRLTLANWRQFREVDIVLHPKLTVVTGANGSGKSTLLNIFSQHFGWSRPYLATPKRGVAGYTYMTGLFDSLRKMFSNQADLNYVTAQIGNIHYTNGQTATINVPTQGSVQYGISIPGQVSVMGLSIGSHRPIQSYQQVASIPTQGILPEQAYSMYFNETIQRYSGNYTQFSPLYRMKEALVSMATFGAGNEYVQRDDVILEAFKGFIEVLRKILPESLGFQDISIRTPDIVLVTKSGEFLLDAASGGIMTLIDLAWQVFLYSRRNPSFVVTLDEPENHLHPSMQRSLMSSLIKAFPSVQFIVATHSPFIVSSVQDSNVYVLTYAEEEVDALGDGGRRVRSLKLDTINKAGSAGEILRDVLGVKATVPEWVEDNLAQIVKSYRNRQITRETLVSLRSDLTKLGYGELYPDALASLTQGL